MFVSSSLPMTVNFNPQPFINALQRRETPCQRLFNCCISNPTFLAIQRLSKERIEVLLQEVARHHFQANSRKLMDRSLTHISLERLLTQIDITEEQLNIYIRCFASCHENLRYGDLYLSSLFSTYRNQSRFKRGVHAFFETILSAFSFVRIGHEAESSWEASYVLQVYGKIISVPFLFMGLLATLSVSFSSALIITMLVTAAVAGSLFAYLKWMRPFPERVRNFHNLNSIAMRGELPLVIGRTKEMDQALFLLDVGINPLIIGPPGTGKTSFIGGIAQRIQSGDVPDGLKRKQIIAGNSSHLADGFSLDGDRLTRFQAAIEGEQKEAIPAFDEVHTIMNTQSRIGERFKSATDKSAESFSVCLGATTPADYKRHFDAAWMRRFPALISLESLGKEETILLLRYMQCREFMDLDVSQEVLEAIYKHSSEMTGYSQPDASKTIFLKCAAHVRMTEWNTESRQKLAGLKREETGLCSLFISAIGSEREKEIGKKLSDKRSELQKLQEIVDGELKMEKEVLQLRHEKEKTLSQISFIASEILKMKKKSDQLSLKNEFIFLCFYYLRFLEAEIKSKSQERPRITIELVEKMIKETVDQTKHALEEERKGKKAEISSSVR